MKWIKIVVCLLVIGCATPAKHKPTHHHRKPTKVTVVGDDAAVKAIIKSLRE